jgi:hypothetical protein
VGRRVCGPHISLELEVEREVPLPSRIWPQHSGYSQSCYMYACLISHHGKTLYLPSFICFALYSKARKVFELHCLLVISVLIYFSQFSDCYGQEDWDSICGKGWDISHCHDMQAFFKVCSSIYVMSSGDYFFQGMKLTTHLHLVPRLRMQGTSPPLLIHLCGTGIIFLQL